MRLRILIGAAIVLIPLSIWRVVSYRSDPAPNMTSEQAAIHEDRINGNVEGLVEKVKTYKTGNARRATIVLGTLGPAALPKLKTILREDTRPAVQEQAVYAIAEVVRSEVSVDKPLTKKMTVDLVEAMADEKIPPTVRAAAASSLGRIYDYNNMDSLLKAMDDKDLGVRISAHEAVSKIFGRKYKFDARVASAQRQIVIKEIAQAWETYKNRVGTYHDGNRKPAKR
jgi:hypothetical protein